MRYGEHPIQNVLITRHVGRGFLAVKQGLHVHTAVTAYNVTRRIKQHLLANLQFLMPCCSAMQALLTASANLDEVVI